MCFPTIIWPYSLFIAEDFNASNVEHRVNCLSVKSKKMPECRFSLHGIRIFGKGNVVTTLALDPPAVWQEEVIAAW